MSHNSNMDRQSAGDRLKALGFNLDGAVNFTWIVLHHSGSGDGSKTYDWPGIKTYHKSYRYAGDIITKDRFESLRKEGKRQAPGELEAPWVDVGYHAGIELVNDAYKVSVGRSLRLIGSHVAGLNAQAIGICHVGNFDVATPPMALWDVSILLTVDLMRWFSVPLVRVIGHREAYAHLGQPKKKECPGIKWDLDQYRNIIRGRLEAAVA